MCRWVTFVRNRSKGYSDHLGERRLSGLRLQILRYFLFLSESYVAFSGLSSLRGWLVLILNEVKLVVLSASCKMLHPRKQNLSRCFRKTSTAGWEQVTRVISELTAWDRTRRLVDGQRKSLACLTCLLCGACSQVAALGVPKTLEQVLL